MIIQKLIYINIRSVRSNLSELRNLIENEIPDVVFLQETFIAQDSKFPFIDGYNVSWKGRQKNKDHGGVAVLARKGIKQTTLKFVGYNNSHRSEIIGKRLILTNGSHLDFISSYVPPNARKGDILDLDCIDWKNSIMAGDFNAHDSQWSNGKQNSKVKAIESLCKSLQINKLHLKSKPNCFE